MQIKTVEEYYYSSDSFDRTVNKLLAEGWQVHDLTVGGAGGSSQWYLVAFLVKD